MAEAMARVVASTRITAEEFGKAMRPLTYTTTTNSNAYQLSYVQLPINDKIKSLTNHVKQDAAKLNQAERQALVSKVLTEVTNALYKIAEEGDDEPTEDHTS